MELKRYLTGQFADGNKEKEGQIANAFTRLRGQEAHFLWVTDPFDKVDPVRLMYVLQLRHLLVNNYGCKVTILINDLHWKEKHIANLLNEQPNYKKEEVKDIVESELGGVIGSMKNMFDTLDLKGKKFELLCDSYIYSDFGPDERSPILSLIRYVEIRDIIEGNIHAEGLGKKYWSFCGDFLETYFNATVIKSNFILTSDFGARHGWLSANSRLLSEMYDNVPVVLEMPTLSGEFLSVKNMDKWKVAAQDKRVIDEKIFKTLSESGKFNSLDISLGSSDESDCLKKLKNVINAINYD